MGWDWLGWVGGEARVGREGRASGQLSFFRSGGFLLGGGIPAIQVREMTGMVYKSSEAFVYEVVYGGGAPDQLRDMFVLHLTEPPAPEIGVADAYVSLQWGPDLALDSAVVKRHQIFPVPAVAEGPQPPPRELSREEKLARQTFLDLKSAGSAFLPTQSGIDEEEEGDPGLNGESEEELLDGTALAKFGKGKGKKKGKGKSSTEAKAKAKAKAKKNPSSRS